MRKRIFITFSLALFLIVSCAAREMRVQVDIPGKELSSEPSGRSILIGQVTDTRSFSERSASPRTPSWGSEDPVLMTEAVKSRAIARNAQIDGRDFGGNVLLEGDQTVESMVKEATRSSFSRAGYTVLSGDTAPEDVIVADVEIAKLWGWFEYQRFSSTISAELEVRIIINNPDGSKKVLTSRTSYENSALHFNRENWQKAFDSLISSYVNGLPAEIRKLDN